MHELVTQCVFRCHNSNAPNAGDQVTVKGIGTWNTDWFDGGDALNTPMTNSGLFLVTAQGVLCGIYE